MQTVSKIVLAGVIGLAMAAGFGQNASAASFMKTGHVKAGHVKTSGKRHTRISKSKKSTPQNLGGTSGQKRMKRSKKNRA